MTTMIDRNTAEAALISSLKEISDSGVRSMSILHTMPALHDSYICALHTWLISVALTTGSCSSIIRNHNTTTEDMAGDMLTRMLNPNRRVCRTRGRSLEECIEAARHPAMDYVLNMAVDADPATVIRYLMRMAYNFCVEKFRREREMRQRTVQSDPETLRHSDSDAADTGAVRSHSTSAAHDGGLTRGETMTAAFSCFDGEFLHDAALLSDALGVPRQRLCDIIYAGHSTALASQLVNRVNEELKGDYTSAFASFLLAARRYRLPEEYRADPRALLRALYRATSSASRQAMKRRILAATA